MLRPTLLTIIMLLLFILNSSSLFAQVKSLEHAYRILGMPPNATTQNIKSARRKALLNFHPDKDLETASHNMAADINAAFDMIMKSREAGKFLPSAAVNMGHNKSLQKYKTSEIIQLILQLNSEENLIRYVKEIQTRGPIQLALLLSLVNTIINSPSNLAANIIEILAQNPTPQIFKFLQKTALNKYNYTSNFALNNIAPIISALLNRLSDSGNLITLLKIAYNNIDNTSTNITQVILDALSGNNHPEILDFLMRATKKKLKFNNPYKALENTSYLFLALEERDKIDEAQIAFRSLNKNKTYPEIFRERAKDYIDSDFTEQSSFKTCMFKVGNVFLK